MSEPKLISPMLDNFAMGEPISSHHGVRSCPAMPKDSDKKYIVKIISIPASRTQLEALLLTGAYSSEASAQAYFKELADGVVTEAEILKRLARLEGFISYDSWQTVPMDKEVGYDIYLLSPYKRSLERLFRRHTMTHLAAVNLGLDLCAALAVCRRAGFLYVDLKPSNVFVSEDQEYRIGDLGFIKLSSLKFASLPDKYRSPYTAPEITDAFSALNTTIDIYAVGLILYQAFNNGELPFEGSAPAEALPAPMYADYEMAEIILKACAPDPKDRWQDPIQMGQALVSYMQRNGANDTPIVPSVVTVPEAPVPEPANTDPADSDAANVDTSDGEPAVQDDDIPAEPEAAGEDASEDALLISEILSVISDGDAPAGEPAPGEDVPAGEDAKTEDIGDLSFLDQLETDETAPSADSAGSIEYQELSDETSDILAQADVLIAHKAPEPVVAPEPIDVPVPPPIMPEPEEETPAVETAPDSPEETASEEEASADVEAPVDEQMPAEDEAVADESESLLVMEGEPLEGIDDHVEAFDAPVSHQRAKKKNKGLQNFLIVLFVLILLAAIGFGAYYYYQNYYLQTIDNLELQGSEDQLTAIIAADIDETLLTAICTDTYGNTTRSQITNGMATFTNLNPGTIYTVRVEISGFHKLQGPTTGSYTTPLQTNVISFNAVAGSEDGSVILGFTVDGPETDTWTIAYSAEGEEEKAVTFTGHMVTVTGLTVGKDYTFRLVPDESLYMVGTEQITYTARAIVYAENLAITACAGDTLTASWSTPEGIEVSEWTVRCYDGVDYDETLTTSETTATFTGIDHTQALTVEVTAAGMTMSARTYVTENSVTVSNVQADTSDPNLMRITWNCTDNVPEGGWLLLYSVEGQEYQEVVRCAENSARIEPMIPGADYQFTLQAASGVTVFDGAFSQQAPDAVAFSGYTVTAGNMTFQMCRTPDKENWSRTDLKASDYTTTFASGERASFLVKLNKSYNTSYDTIVTLYIIRDEAGNLVSTDSQSRSWTSMWYRGYCELDIPAIPDTPGTYTVSVFFNGASVAQETFTVTEAASEE